MVYLVDWLSFTTKKYSYEDMIELLNFPALNWQHIQGFYGYQHSIYHEGIRIHYNEDKVGCFVNLSGQGCRTFESVSPIDWIWLFKLLTEEEGVFNVTRLDIACDEKEGILPIKKIAEIGNRCIDDDWSDVCTKFRWCDVHNSSQGLSVYFGSPKSDIRIRIYDKAAERGCREEHWIRCEMQIRNSLAKNMILSILNLDDIGKSFCGVLNNYLRFIRSIRTEKRNCPNIQWWDRFLQSAEKIRIFYRAGIEYNIYRVKNYLDNQVGNSLQTFVRYHDGDLEDLLKLITRPRNLSKKQLDLIYNRE